MTTVTVETGLAATLHEGLARDARIGLSMTPKELPPKYFYDELGSRLFERITELPEYYPARIERSILERDAAAIVAAAGYPTTLAELGSGSASKTRCLLDAMQARGCLETYVPVDISEEITRRTADELSREYDGLAVHGVICDFEGSLELLPLPGGGRLVAFLGGTIGNLYPDARHDFLARLARILEPEDRLLLGTDLIKERSRLEAAYDDAAGVTAEFNRNVLRVLNRELGAEFDLDAFEHVARYDDREARMDIRLRSLRDQDVRVRALGTEFRFEAGEEMRTEISCKFSHHRLEGILGRAGLRMTHWFTDPGHDFALSLSCRP